MRVVNYNKFAGRIEIPAVQAHIALRLPLALALYTHVEDELRHASTHHYFNVVQTHLLLG